MKKYEAVIFDLDGTLVDSMWMWRAIDIEYLGSFGIEAPDDLKESIEGKNFNETAIYFKERFKLPCTVDKIKESWHEMAEDMYTNEIKLKAGAAALIERLHREKIKLAIATSNSRKLAESILRARGIYDYFDAIVTGCDVECGKPSPEIYNKAAELLAVDPGDCLVFEDLPNGIIAGKSAGMTVCAVADDYSEGFVHYKKMLADYYIDNYNDIINV